MEQIVIPTNIVKKVERLSKELAAVKKEISRAVKITKSQAWFWSKSWQRKEKAADEAIKAGKVHTFSSVNELIRDLHK
ncbi:MAG: AbrB/MazE/SpoVT family DNA-binding domain-containing protein [Candidatus Curtissbacteria bacterium]|nr:AbrB/MazE/SpoVT family DNA-binding domain-containing protein [Candidatus Curtissbacteria bacterium]